MANDVFANGRELACRAGSGKSICAFPDVCMTPPENPATPPGVPVPYPNTGMASDTTSGSKKVKISGKEVMLKNKSYYKKSMGDEAGCAAKKGVVTSVNRGKIYFASWSMDVKFEGENVVRHLDVTTHNHASATTNTGPWPNVDSSAFAKLENCAEDKEAMEKACEGKDPCPGILSTPKKAQRAKHGTTKAAKLTTDEAEKDGNDCVKKSRCYLRPYKPNQKEDGCCPGQTGHHIPPKACFKKGKKYQAGYSQGKALCVCLEGMNQHAGSHGKNHAAIEYLAKEVLGIDSGQTCSLADYNKLCAATVEVQCGCKKECIEDQLNESFKDKDIDEVKHVNTNSSGDISKLKKKIRDSAGLSKTAASR